MNQGNTTRASASLFRLAFILGVGAGLVVYGMQACVHLYASSQLGICNELASHSAQMLSRGDLQSMLTLAHSLKDEKASIDYVALFNHKGEQLLELGAPHPLAPSKDSYNRVNIPIQTEEQYWGSFAIEFNNTLGHVPWKESLTPSLSVYFLLSVSAMAGAVSSLLERRMPENPLPSLQVQAMLDSLCEGVLLLDTSHRITFANRAFRSMIKKSNNLEGQHILELDWDFRHIKPNSLPWDNVESTRDHGRQEIGLRFDADTLYLLSARAAPIVDSAGNLEGILATFDDLTTVESINGRLKKLVQSLRDSQAKIRHQNRALQELATTDALTGCLNRYAFLRQFKRLYAASTRYEFPISCIMLDIDHFKSVNDSKGHMLGDFVLRQVASAIQELIRSSDIFGRMGGDEFCIVLDHSHLDAACQCADRYRESIEKIPFDDLQVTASIGVASSMQGAESVDELLEQSDQALYASKRIGRNRVMAFESASELVSVPAFASPQGS